MNSNDAAPLGKREFDSLKADLKKFSFLFLRDALKKAYPELDADGMKALVSRQALNRDDKLRNLTITLERCDFTQILRLLYKEWDRVKDSSADPAVKDIRVPCEALINYRNQIEHSGQEIPLTPEIWSTAFRFGIVLLTLMGAGNETVDVYRDVDRKINLFILEDRPTDGLASLEEELAPDHYQLSYDAINKLLSGEFDDDFEYEAILSEKLKDFLAHCDERQREVASSEVQNTCVIAGPGSGKTRTLIARIASLIRIKRVKPQHILVITYTNKAARELRDRLCDLLSESELRSVTVSTIHGFCFRLIRNNPPFGLQKGFRILDAEEQDKLLLYCRRVILRKKEAGDYALKAYDLKKIVNEWQSKNLCPADIDVNTLSTSDALALEVYDFYFKGLIALNCCDFAMLLLGANKMLRSGNHLTWPATLKYVLVDEFQDINPVTYTLIVNLNDYFEGKLNVTAVGDDDQSIYGFRYSDPRFLTDFCRDFAADELQLVQNYRSAGQIVGLSKKLIDNNKNRIRKNLFTENDAGIGPVFRELGNQGEFLAKEILRLHKEEKIAYKDIAVLYRMHSSSAVAETQLAIHKIPFQLYKTKTYFDQPEIKKILALLIFIDKPDDNIAFRRLMDRSIDIEDIRKIIAYKKEFKTSYYESALRISCPSESLDNFLSKLDEIAKFKNRPISTDAVQEIINIYDLAKEYEDLFDESGVNQAQENIARFPSLVPEFLGVMNADLANEDGVLDFEPEDAYMNFASRLALFASEIASRKETDAVQIMAIHSSKGLEFNTVFIVDVQTFNLHEGDEEKRRVLYVAMTRAMKHLYILGDNMDTCWLLNNVVTPDVSERRSAEDEYCF